jgi:hypothetical protein
MINISNKGIAVSEINTFFFHSSIRKMPITIDDNNAIVKPLHEYIPQVERPLPLPSPFIPLARHKYIYNSQWERYIAFR